MEDTSEGECGKKPCKPGGEQETTTPRPLDFPLKLLQMQPNCQVYPDLHRIIQVRSAVAERPRV